jgi:aryl-alcohol dehydrogenase-like predicted oxidoreductase
VSSVIDGATSPGQIRTNAAAPNWDLSEEDLEEISRLAPID